MENQKSVIAARILLGLPFVVFGLNGFLHFIPMGAMNERAMDIMMAYVRTGYFLPFLAASQVIGGLMLLSGFFVPLGLLILAPIIANIVLFHLFLTPGPKELILPAVLVALGLFLAKKYSAVFAPILKPRQDR